MSISTPPPKNPIDLQNLLDKGLNNHPDAPALLTVDRSWNWRELDVDSTDVAKKLSGDGIDAR